MKTKGRRSAPGERRREAIMEVAWALFMKKGYAAVSVDEVVRKAGGSKSSLYEFFGSKEGLFLELVTAVSDEIFKEVEIQVEPDQAPREALKRIGMAVCTKVLTQRGIGLYRLAVSISGMFPEVARMFYEAGPRSTQHGIARFLKKEVAAKRLRIKDTARAAEFFLGMLLVKDHIALPLGCGAFPSRSKTEGIVDDAVDVFMAAYGK